MTKKNHWKLISQNFRSNCLRPKFLRSISFPSNSLNFGVPLSNLQSLCVLKRINQSFKKYRVLIHVIHIAKHKLVKFNLSMSMCIYQHIYRRIIIIILITALFINIISGTFTEKLFTLKCLLLLAAQMVIRKRKTLAQDGINIYI